MGFDDSNRRVTSTHFPHSSDLENAAADEGNLGDRRESHYGSHVQAPASWREQAEGARHLGSVA
jgi:hypothetical protein